MHKGGTKNQKEAKLGCSYSPVAFALVTASVKAIYPLPCTSIDSPTRQNLAPWISRSNGEGRKEGVEHPMDWGMQHRQRENTRMAKS